MISIEACSPQANADFLNPELLWNIVQQYNLGERILLNVQCQQAKTALSELPLQGISEVLRHLRENKKAFSLLIKTRKIALTLGFSTATCERTFSCQKRTKTYLRNTMTDERLSNLAILAIERDLSSDWLRLEDVIDRFSKGDEGRRIRLK